MNISLIIIDFVLILFSLMLSTFLRFELSIPLSFVSQKILFFINYSILMVGTLWIFGDYEEKWEYSSLREFMKTILTFFSVNVFLGLFFYFSEGFFIPRTIFLTSIPISMLLLVLVRIFYRGLKEYSVKEEKMVNSVIVCREKNVEKIFDSLKNQNIVAIFFQEKLPKGRLFKGIPIYYDISYLKRMPVNEIFIDKDISQEFYLRVIENKPAGSLVRKVEFLPSLFIQNFRVEDVINREKRIIDVEIDPDKIYLVIGAGGSIGKHITKELIFLGAKNIKLLDYSEENLHNLMLELIPFDKVHKEFLLFDIKDKFLSRYIGEVDIVFHCAANKHVPIVEENKYTSYKTNITGLMNIIECIRDNQKEFVFISTDKAVNPTSFMGLTKRMGELITLSYKDDFSKAIVVRFGNVFGTSGSLIPTVIKQINMYGKVFLTHEEVRRFFMMPEEAAKLIISSLKIPSGKIAVLDMGEQIKIREVIEKIIQIVSPHRKIEIEITGLKKGEKLQEELFYEFERTIQKWGYIFIVDPKIEIRKEEILSFIKDLESGINNASDIDKYLEENIRSFVFSTRVRGSV
ncbi:MAG: polysaccharide biosynthesis protein [Candidatus Calescibacterium sp.]|nr:polysaccharide biosynthesis protein [Candidatus Calescibacterium sp.]MCX7972503.1 polysaccharide biosynthesis protein [bacterium]MDW8195605.1 polysaccharide biosynthesis protein [Candidatus Calescibacterium sp.]